MSSEFICIEQLLHCYIRVIATFPGQPG